MLKGKVEKSISGKGASVTFYNMDHKAVDLKPSLIGSDKKRSNCAEGAAVGGLCLYMCAFACAFVWPQRWALARPCALFPCVAHVQACSVGSVPPTFLASRESCAPPAVYLTVFCLRAQPIVRTGATFSVTPAGKRTRYT